jgi:cyclic pyranopterin phosphate synthase
MSQLIDPIGRRIRKLRISLTDVCNFRCTYCMPEHTTFMPADRYLSPSALVEVTSHLISRGVEEVRITGGEPTMRREFREIVTRLSELPLKKLGLTTNGLLLQKHLSFLAETRCHHINVSLDSLNEDNFNRITRRNAFRTVMDALIATKSMRFPVKINAVLMRGVNDHELLDFVRFSERHDIPVRFLELMRIGQACQNQSSQFMTAAEALAILKQEVNLERVPSPLDSTSFNFRTSGGGSIGFIASESQPFCGTCSRWRLSADGFLRACLMSEAGVDIKGIPFDQYPAVFEQLFAMKPTGRIYEIHQDMHRIGG